MATKTFTIDNAKLQQAEAPFLEVYPNTEVDGNGDPKYTNIEWFWERIRRFAVETVHRGETKIAQDAAKAALQKDDNLVT